MSRYDAPAGGRENVAESRYQQEKRHPGGDADTAAPAVREQESEALTALRRNPAAATLGTLAALVAGVAAIVVVARRRAATRAHKARTRPWLLIRRR